MGEKDKGGIYIADQYGNRIEMSDIPTLSQIYDGEDDAVLKDAFNDGFEATFTISDEACQFLGTHLHSDAVQRMFDRIKEAVRDCILKIGEQ